MRAIMVMFDTLSRRFLSTYGADGMITPNFQRLEERCHVFDHFYGGSLPCMPARRELHTGRYNFLHRGWGPLEPFDCSVIEELKTAGVYTHLVTDHSHYFEDGGATYHNRYDTWEGFRGQEGDRWVPRLGAEIRNSNPRNKQGISVVQHYANRERMAHEEEMPSVRTISAGLEFLEDYYTEDRWFLQIECFDPHEPFYVPEKYRELYQCGSQEEAFNWPPYQPSDITQEELGELRKEYAALITMCDHHLGRILDFMDDHDMWKDTMLIVNTDHGFMLGEKGYLGKNYMPMYDEIVHLPFYIHVPGISETPGRRDSLAQTIDIAPTLLEFFGAGGEDEDMDGRSLIPVVRDRADIHENILYGIHGGHVNIFDGTHVLMKAPEGDNEPLVSLTLMPSNMRGFFPEEVLKLGKLTEGSRFTNGVPCMKYPEKTYLNPGRFGDLLFDMKVDPEQKSPVDNKEIKTMMCEKLRREMEKTAAPREEFLRLGLWQNGGCEA